MRAARDGDPVALDTLSTFVGRTEQDEALRGDAALLTYDRDPLSRALVLDLAARYVPGEAQRLEKAAFYFVLDRLAASGDIDPAGGIPDDTDEIAMVRANAAARRAAMEDPEWAFLQALDES